MSNLGAQALAHVARECGRFCPIGQNRHPLAHVARECGVQPSTDAWRDRP